MNQNYIPPPPRNVGNTLGSGVPVEIQPSQLAEQIRNLQAVTEEAHSLTAALENKTSAVTRQEIEAPTNKTAPQEHLVPIAEAIRDVVQAIDANNNRLRSLLGRIEL